MKFKIGHYFDEVLCDIMPMNCCHILFGRPWQYDRYVVHDGRSNKFEKEVKKNQVFFAIIPRGPSVGSNDQVIAEAGNDRVLEEIIELLNEYKDIVAKNIPDGLPPVRSICHCMNLIPGASFPNKAPYRLTHT